MELGYKNWSTYIHGAAGGGGFKARNTIKTSPNSSNKSLGSENILLFTHLQANQIEISFNDEALSPGAHGLAYFYGNKLKFSVF